MLKAQIDQKTGNVSFEDADESLDVDAWPKKMFSACCLG